MKTNLLSSIFILFSQVMFSQVSPCQILGGPYLGQSLPGLFPEPFAQGIIPEITPSITFTGDGLECYYTQWSPGTWSIILSTKEEGGIWPEPDTASFSVEMDESPHLTPDGNRIYFIAKRPVPGSPYLERHLWYTDRIGTSWTEPALVDSLVNAHYIISASAAANGNLYLSLADDNEPEIYVSKYVNGHFLEPEKLSDSINYLPRTLRPHIAPDESFVLFDATESYDPFSQTDLFISYRKPDQSWSKAVALDGEVNTAMSETTPFLSRDNQYLFFARDGVTQWMQASNVLVTGIDKYPEAGPSMPLVQNYPNPFRESTTITYNLLEPGHITIAVYNLQGERVAVLINDEKPAGQHTAIFHQGSLPPGVYLYMMKTENSVIWRNMVLEK